MATVRNARTSAPLRRRWIDAGLSALLLLQGFTLFVAIPLANQSPPWRMVLDVCHLAFAVICIGVLTRHRAIQIGLFAALTVLAGGPALLDTLAANLHLGTEARHEAIALGAFIFNGGVTALVARHVFAPGRVTVHRIRGAILLYLNVAALFAIAYGAFAMHVSGAFAGTGTFAPTSGGVAGFSYFSLATITTTGYGDVVPVHPLVRSLANLEAVFGQLFPATLLTRLVSLHLVHERETDASG